MRDIFIAPFNLSGKVKYESMLLYAQDIPYLVILHFINKDLYFLAETFWPSEHTEEYIMVRINSKMIGTYEKDIAALESPASPNPETGIRPIHKYMDQLMRHSDNRIYHARFHEKGGKYTDAYTIEGLSVSEACNNFTKKVYKYYFYDSCELTEIKCPGCSGRIMFTPCEKPNCPITCNCGTRICPVCFKETKEEFTPDGDCKWFRLFGCECGWQHCGGCV